MPKTNFSEPSEDHRARWIDELREMRPEDFRTLYEQGFDGKCATSSIVSTPKIPESKDLISEIRDAEEAMKRMSLSVGKASYSMKEFGKAMTGLSADSVIIDDPIPQEKNVNPEGDGLLSKIKTASDLDFSLSESGSDVMSFSGGMVTLKTDKGFRRKAIPACTLLLHNCYDGKKKGVICQFVPATPEDDRNARGAVGSFQEIEIPLKELTDYFELKEVWRLINDTYVGEPYNKKLNLYSEDAISELPDFGVF